MRNKPSDAQLLKAARQTVLDRLVPRLPESCREDALLVVQAIDHVYRRLQSDAGWPALVRERLAALYGTAATDGIEDRFATDLREGAFEADACARGKARDILREIAARKLAEDNPDYPR